jgi:ABC-2 type transport system permease protein
MRTAALTLRQFRYEQKIFRRTPAAMFFVAVFPVVLLVIFASLNRGQRVGLLGGLRFTQYYVPAIAAFGLMSSCYANVAGRFVYRRETGTLKRLRGAPVPLVALVGGFLANAVVVGAAVSVINVGVGAAFYGVVLPNRWAAFFIVLLIGAASFCALGVAVSCFIPNLDSADPIIWGTFMPLIFISGTFFPIPDSSPLAHLASLFPMQHLVKAAFAAFDLRRSGAGIAWADLGVVATWGVIGCVVALRRFRWEPARS